VQVHLEGDVRPRSLFIDNRGGPFGRLIEVNDAMLVRPLQWNVWNCSSA